MTEYDKLLTKAKSLHIAIIEQSTTVSLVDKAKFTNDILNATTCNQVEQIALSYNEYLFYNSFIKQLP